MLVEEKGRLVLGEVRKEMGDAAWGKSANIQDFERIEHLLVRGLRMCGWERV